MPLQETIDITINLIFNPNPNLSIIKEELKKLFLFATSQTHFIFSSKFHNQIEGVVMGSPLAPVFANIFMGFYESSFIFLNIYTPLQHALTRTILFLLK